MSRRKVDTAKMQEMFSKSHELGAAKFGGIWLMANRQAIRACVDVGLDYTAPQMKALLSMAAWNILLNVHEAIASVHESRDPQAVRAGNRGSDAKV